MHMQLLAKYMERQVYWVDYESIFNGLPDKVWLCLAIANQQPDLNRFDCFVRSAIAKNILEFKGHGVFGEKLHDLFDETMVAMKVIEGQQAGGVMTTWHNDETLADTFWQCFFVTCLPETADLDNIKIICTDLDGINRAVELTSYIDQFVAGWLPPEKD